jgi:hypothetical protein
MSKLTGDNASDIIKNAGYTAKIFRGIPIAVEYHKDGSVTLCKEIVEEICFDKDVPLWIKDLL